MRAASPYHAWCTACGPQGDGNHACGAGGSLQFTYARWQPAAGAASLWRYRSYLPVDEGTPAVTLGEGQTPLIEADGRVFGGPPRVWFKDETRNPTGSMKDRAMTVAYTRVKTAERPRTIIASAGGSGIAAAAYAARAGVPHWVMVPSDVSVERLVLPAVYGAHIVRVAAPFEAIAAVVDEASALGYTNVSTYRRANPFQAEAPKTIAYELVEQLGRAPKVVIVPVGGGGTLAGMWQGFKDLRDLGLIHDLPRMVSVQNALFNALERVTTVSSPGTADLRRVSAEIDESLPTATPSVRHAYPPDGDLALNALAESQGLAVSATDSEALEGQRLLAEQVGIFCEASSGLAIAAISKVHERVREDGDVVVIVTGSGFRDLGATASRWDQTLPTSVSLNEALDALGG